MPILALAVGALVLQPTYIHVVFQAPAAGTMAVSGRAPTLAFGSPPTVIVIPTATAVVTTAGRLPTVRFAVTAGLGVGRSQLTGSGTTLRLVGPTPLAAGSITLTGAAPSLGFTGSATIVPLDTATLTLAPTYVQVWFQTPDVGRLTLTGYAPAVGSALARLVSVPAGNLTLVGQVSSVGASGTRALGVGTLQISGRSASLSSPGALTIPDRTLTLTGLVPILSRTTAIPGGSLTLTGRGVSLAAATVQRPLGVGVLQLTGLAPTLGGQLVIGVPAGSLVLAEPVPHTTGAVMRRVGPRRWLRASPHIVADRQRVFYAALQVQMEVGVGDFTALGLDPQASLRWSDDGGKTWSASHEASMGPQGKRRTRVIWRRLGWGRDRVLEVSGTAPVKTVLLDAYLVLGSGKS